MIPRLVLYVMSRFYKRQLLGGPSRYLLRDGCMDEPGIGTQTWIGASGGGEWMCRVDGEVMMMSKQVVSIW